MLIRIKKKCGIFVNKKLEMKVDIIWTRGGTDVISGWQKLDISSSDILRTILSNSVYLIDKRAIVLYSCRAKINK